MSRRWYPRTNGAAVQIGGSLAQFFAKKFNLSKEDVRMLLTSGIAAGRLQN